MRMLRQFFYLDADKVYSLHSQLFEGFTDYVVRYAEAKSSESTEQKGPFTSGRILADLAITTQGRQERQFLHDYLYTLFEGELASQREVLEVGPALPPSIQRRSLLVSS